jgi:hypothetical protein
MPHSKITSLPDTDRVMRHVGWAKLLKDPENDDKVIGFLPQAFQRRGDEESLSVRWIEYYTDSDDAEKIRKCALEERGARTIGPKSAFAIGRVGQVKDVCRTRGASVRIVHEPKDNEPSHSGIRRLPRDDLVLLDALASEAFADMVLNSEIP